MIKIICENITKDDSDRENTKMIMIKIRKKKGSMIMGYDLELILQKAKTPLICILDGQTQTFESADAFLESDFEKHCGVSTIGIEDGKMVLHLKKLAPKNDLNQPWVKDYMKDWGCEPSFF